MGRPPTRLTIPAILGLLPLILAAVFPHGQPRGPYNWVSPPPPEAGDNIEPIPQSFSIPFTANGSNAGAFGTVDLQANLIMSEGAIPDREGQESVELTIEPLAPQELGEPPPGRQFVGNVYRFAATYQPGGEPVQELVRAVTLGMVYPEVSHEAAHEVFGSADGQAWDRLETIDQHAQSYATTGVDRLGLYGVTVPAAGGAGAPPASSGSAPLLPIGLGVLALVVLIGLRAATARRRPRRPGGARPRVAGSRR